MANPNIAAATSILGESVTKTPTSTPAYQTIFQVPADTVYKINSISVCNNSAASAVVTLSVQPFMEILVDVANTISVPENTTLILISKDTSFYLPALSYMYCNANPSSTVDFLISYEAIS